MQLDTVAGRRTRERAGQTPAWVSRSSARLVGRMAGVEISGRRSGSGVRALDSVSSDPLLRTYVWRHSSHLTLFGLDLRSKAGRPRRHGNSQPCPSSSSSARTLRRVGNWRLDASICLTALSHQCAADAGTRLHECPSIARSPSVIVVISTIWQISHYAPFPTFFANHQFQ